MPTTPADIERRLTDLEIKASYSEDTLDRLNDVVVRQQQQIDALLRALAALQRRPGALDGDADADVPRGVRDDRPPHW